jgi:hypothetical protein
MHGRESTPWVARAGPAMFGLWLAAAAFPSTTAVMLCPANDAMCHDEWPFLALGEAAGGATIGLQDIDRPVDEDRSKAPAGKLGLASGDRDTKGRLHLTIREPLPPPKVYVPPRATSARRRRAGR